jgi:hypothetical protein
MRSMDFETGFDMCGSLSCGVAFEDYSAMEEILADWKI